MASGRVDTLLMLETNPIYSAPADLDFAAALKRVPLSVSLSLYADETAEASTWLIPATHEYEAWSDARAFDGTVDDSAAAGAQAIRRPFGAGAAGACCSANTSPDDYALVRGYWQQEAQQKARGDFEAFWHESLRRGVVTDSAAAAVTVAPKSDLTAGLPPPVPAEAAITLLFRPDRSLGTAGMPTTRGCWRCRGLSRA